MAKACTQAFWLLKKIPLIGFPVESRFDEVFRNTFFSPPHAGHASPSLLCHSKSHFEQILNIYKKIIKNIFESN
jgi:hypothetical protein